MSGAPSFQWFLPTALPGPPFMAGPTSLRTEDGRFGPASTGSRSLNCHAAASTGWRSRLRSTPGRAADAGRIRIPSGRGLPETAQEGARLEGRYGRPLRPPICRRCPGLDPCCSRRFALSHARGQTVVSWHCSPPGVSIGTLKTDPGMLHGLCVIPPETITPRSSPSCAAEHAARGECLPRSPLPVSQPNFRPASTARPRPTLPKASLSTTRAPSNRPVTARRTTGIWVEPPVRSTVSI